MLLEAGNLEERSDAGPRPHGGDFSITKRGPAERAAPRDFGGGALLRFGEHLSGFRSSRWRLRADGKAGGSDGRFSNGVGAWIRFAVSAAGGKKVWRGQS